MEGTKHSVIDITTLYRSKASGLSLLSPHCCIYKVPNRLRIINKNAYTPQVVSIGPHHHGNEALIAMEQHKWRYLHHFIQTYDLDIQHFMDIVNIKEAKIRDYYADHITYDRDDLTVIVMLDAVFIIGILLRFYSKVFDNFNENDRIYYKPWMIQHIVPDLQLLENQIPFFIIEDIYEGMKTFASFPPSARELSMKEVAYKFFKYNVGFMEDDEVNQIKCDKILHFVDLGRKLCIQEEQSPIIIKESYELLFVDAVRRFDKAGDEPVSVRRFSITAEKDRKKRQSLKKMKVPTITKLHCSGVRFKVGPPNEMFKIKFDNGTLSIPKLFINDNTELFLRNIIAFEQCNCLKFTISNYFAIIKRLVYTHQDLKLLFEYGIVDHALGDSKDVFSLITKLADEITVDYTDSDFVSLCENMDDYCKKSRHK